MARPAVDIRLLGDKKAARALAQMEARLQKKIVRKAIREGAKKAILPEVKSRVPVDTGKLKKSLKIRAIKRSRSMIGVLVRTGTRTDLGIAPDATGYYPFSIEFGYRHNRTGQMIPPRPYMRPALDSKSDEAKRIIGMEIRAGIEREAAKLR